MTEVEVQNISLDTKTPLQVNHWDEERVYFSGDFFFRDMFFDLEKAQKSVLIESYIFNSGKLTDNLLKILLELSRKGVSIKIIIDGFGSWSYPFEKIKHFNNSGIYFGIYHPVPFLFSFSFFQNWGNLNKRNHQKICLIDDQTAYVGSMNFTDEHLSEVCGNKAWKDAGVRVKGTEIKFLVDGFNHIWKNSWKLKKLKINLHIFRAITELPKLLRLNQKINLKKNSQAQLENIIKTSLRRVWISNAYFVPNKSLINLLISSAIKGVDVRILIPANSDVQIERLAAIAFYEKLINSGVKIYEYKLGMYHAKTILSDDVGLIGSSNMNHRSFLHDLEADVYIYEKKNLEIMKEEYLEALVNSDEIKKMNQHPYLIVILARFVLFVRYWL